MELTELTPERRTRLDEAVREQVVRLTHPDFADGWDLWWRTDYERFLAAHPEAEADFEQRPASLEDAAPFLNLLDPIAPTFALFNKGFRRHRYQPE